MDHSDHSDTTTATDSGMDMGMGGHDAMGGPPCKISMLWNWYTTDACFLSPSWQITGQGSFAATCIGIMLMVVLLEALRRLGKEYDAWILRAFNRRISALAAQKEISGVSTQGAVRKRLAMPWTSSSPDHGDRQTISFRASPLQQLVRSLLYAATFGLAYIIMLLAMYYNGYIIFCIIIGAFIGKFLCDWMTRKIVIGIDQGASGVDACGGGIEDPTVCCG
ncbi:putative high affinity copper protein [Podospora appendiculata]|uniref:Copper transport protein n=1 Tax=Podospora appendiculata TaxID=314037 RepID=A0AAE0XIL9_9PEZI|nr:putative high affinity copper protein [Podospora appendiculata]